MDIQYQEYLKSDHWQVKRQNVLFFWGGKCCICKSSDRVEVHHNTYEHMGDERMSEVVALCHQCHELFSKKLEKVPDSYEVIFEKFKQLAAMPAHI